MPERYFIIDPTKPKEINPEELSFTALKAKSLVVILAEQVNCAPPVNEDVLNGIWCVYDYLDQITQMVEHADNSRPRGQSGQGGESHG